MTITAAADGSSLGNPGPTGWAWYIDDARWAAGGFPTGTNNIGELTAVAELLDATAGSDEPLHIMCDSKYVIDSCTKWIHGWKRNGWKKKDGKPVLNVELIKRIDAAMRGREVEFEWVKGHAGHRENEAADDRARAAATAFAERRAPNEGPGFGGGAVASGAAAPGSGRTASGAGTGAAATSAGSSASVDRAPSRPAAASSPTALAVDEPDEDVAALFDLDDDDQAAAGGEREVLELERRSLEGGRSALDEVAHPEFETVAADGTSRERADAVATAMRLRPDTLRAIEVGAASILVVGDAEWRSGRVSVSSLWTFDALGPGDGAWRLRFRQLTPVR